MNKKLIAIAIASIMAAPVAMADIKVSGQIGAELTGSDKNSGKGVDGTASSREMGDYGMSKLTVDGTQGDAYARVGLNIGNVMQDAALKNRDFYVGYNFGASHVQAGRMVSALAGLEGDKYNATFMQIRRTSAVATTSNTLTDSFTASPVLEFATKVGGAKIKVQYDPADNTTKSGAEAYAAISVKGTAGPVGYFAGYNNGAGTEGTPANDDSNTKIGASMKFGSAKATVMVMNSDNDGLKNDAAVLFVDMGFGNGFSGDVAYGENKAKDTWARLAVTKKVNAGTRFYAGLTNKKANAATASTVLGAGMVVKF